MSQIPQNNHAWYITGIGFGWWRGEESRLRCLPFVYFQSGLTDLQGTTSVFPQVVGVSSKEDPVSNALMIVAEQQKP